MKILHININEHFGGASRAANRLHQGFLNAGMDSRMLVINKETNDESVIKVASLYTQNEKFKLFLRKIYVVFISLLGTKRDSRFNPPSLLMGTLKRIDFDILVLHWVTHEFINFRELLHINKPIIWTMHDCAGFTGICHVIGDCENYNSNCGNCPLIKSKKKNDISHKEYLRKLRIFKHLNIHFISPSRWLAAKAKESPLLENKSITIIPNGLQVEMYSPIDRNCAREILNLGIDKKIILCGAVTLIDSNKGFMFFKEAISKIPEIGMNPFDIEVILFGTVSNDLLLPGVKTHNLGFIHDELLLRAIYCAADVMVVPSLQESFGLAAIESISCGIPVVAFGATGLLDIIDHKSNGYLAKPYESYDLALGIKWCLENNKDSLLSKNARLKAVTSFKIEKVVQNHLDLYQLILGYK